MDLSKLKEPIGPDEIEWRVGQSGSGQKGPWAKLLAYVTNRAIMNRLDAVCGPENWQNEYRAAPNDPTGTSLICGISIRIDGEWVTKWDGAANTEVSIDGKPDQDTNLKGGFSNSMKRAAVQWGIGRDLYDYGTTWAVCQAAKPDDPTGWTFAKNRDGAFWWKPPAVQAPKKAPTPTQKAAARKTAPKPDAPLDYRKIVKKTLAEVCGCQNTEEADACINEITKGMYTAVAELDKPEDAEAIHKAMCEYAETPGNRLEGLAAATHLAAILPQGK
jgi:hypothetical protein